MAQVLFETTMGHGVANDRVTDPEATPDERTYALFTHLTLILAHFVFVPVVAPLIMWQIKKDQSPFLNDHGKEAVNFQISLLLYGLIGFALTFACGIGFAVWAAAYVLAIVGMILAAVAANRGQYFRYPATLRLIK